MSAKRALITGITGQDGSYLAELLLENGYEVFGLTRRLSADNYWRIDHLKDQLTLIAGDLLDQLSLIRALEKVIRAAKPLFVDRALGAAACERIWQLRREFSYSLRDTGLTKLNEDIVVPRGRLEDLFRFTAALQKKHRLPVACFGHAGDGNIHVNVMVDRSDTDAERRSEEALDELFRHILALKGVITGEHGIGIAKQRWWPLAANADVRALHRTVKYALDPNGILNPGKFV